ncbi:MAG TPA: carbonic anhydrase [Xanthobacteraceae bacterium]|jgi:carbonic anhydrase|nr:carbonic anhydrase [Xanthobacteraceae bacterium]
MCIACSTFVPNRRRFLSLAAAGVAAASVLGARSAFAAGATTSVTADEALARLKAGNEKYISAPQVCAVDLLKHREDVAKGQAPWAAILSCADSRVPPELLFGGLGVGELFIARNAGNMADTATMGTIEYGVEHLGVPLVVVMGHERCGAVAAACEVVEKHTKFPGSIGPMVDAIVPAAKAVYGKPGDFVDNTVRESAKRTAAKIATKSEIVSHFIKDNKVKVLAARYDLDDGRVEFLT